METAIYRTWLFVLWSVKMGFRLIYKSIFSEILTFATVYQRFSIGDIRVERTWCIIFWQNDTTTRTISEYNNDAYMIYRFALKSVLVYASERLIHYIRTLAFIDSSAWLFWVCVRYWWSAGPILIDMQGRRRKITLGQPRDFTASISNSPSKSMCRRKVTRRKGMMAEIRSSDLILLVPLPAQKKK